MPDPALVVEDYSFWFKLPDGGRALALDDVSFEVAHGELALILGVSGSGKSTLALNLVGIYPDFFGGYNQGRILVHRPGKGLVNRREIDRGERFATVNMLFQNPEDQIVTLTAAEEVAFALENYLVPAADIPARVDRALDLVGLTGFQERSTLKLSGGEKQRLALAAMLAMEPRVLILDEPTSNLDPVGTAEVLDAIDRVRESLDITLMVVEHEVDEIFHKADRVLMVDGHKVLGPYQPRGFIAERGLHLRDELGLWIPQAAELSLGLRDRGIQLDPLPLTAPELVGAVRRLTPAAGSTAVPEAAAAVEPAPAPPGDTPRIDVAPPDRAGAAVTASPPAPAGAPTAAPAAVPGEPVIQVRDLRFGYATRPEVLRGVDLDVRRGELLAILGQNGSGKSTLASLLNGILKPTGGQVLVDGKPTTAYRFADLAKRVAYIFQVPEKQFIRNNVADEMAHGLKALKLPPAEISVRVEEMLDRVRLADRRDASPYVLSHGQKRRLSVACMVINDPDVVILDEPTFGQDHRQAHNLMQLLRGLADHGSGVAFITHDMRLTAQYADRCVALAEGQVVFDGPPADLYASPELLARTKLRAPPVFHIAQELFGERLLDTAAVGHRIQESVDGPRAVV